MSRQAALSSFIDSAPPGEVRSAGPPHPTRGFTEGDTDLETARRRHQSDQGDTRR